MKAFYFFLIMLTLSIASFAQKEGASKIYGYKQRVMPGMVRVDENGREIPREPNYNYFIYLVSSCNVKPIELWINGEEYEVQFQKLDSTPVKYSDFVNPDDKPVELVPKVKGNVQQLHPSPNKMQKPGQKGKTLSAKNELVVIYEWKGKLFYKVLPKLKELPPVAMQ